MIHLLDSNEKIIDNLVNTGAKKAYWGTKFTRDTSTGLFTFDVTTNIRRSFDNVTKLIAQEPDGALRLFLISALEKNHSDNGLIYTIGADGDYASLSKAKPLAPTTLTGATTETAVAYAIAGTDCVIGQVDFLGTQDITTTEYLSPWAFLQQVQSTFGGILDLRVEISGNSIVKYVDFKSPDDTFSGVELEFNRNIEGISVKEDRTKRVTRMVGEAFDSDGKLVTFAEINDGKDYVEDDDAYQRWNINGQHIYQIHQYDSESEDGTIDKQKMMNATQQAMRESINGVTAYQVTGIALEQMDIDYQKIRTYMNIRIKDTDFDPALYLTAQVTYSEMPEMGDPNGGYVYQFGDYQKINVSTDQEIENIQKKLLRNSNTWTSAKGDAVEAKQTANVANTTANDASQTAVSAQGTANTAQQTASDAANTANQAYTQATNAAQTADDALTAANGKNTNYYGPDPPTDPHPGDNWFVEDDSGTITAIKHWDGSHWVIDVDNASINDAIAQAQQDVTSALSQANSAYDTVNHLSQDVQTAFDNAQSALEKINNLRISSRNLVIDSTFNSGDLTHWQAAGGTGYKVLPPEGDKPSSNIVHLSNGDGNVQIWSDAAMVNVDGSQEFVVSFDIKIDDLSIVEDSDVIFCVRTVTNPRDNSSASSSWQQYIRKQDVSGLTNGQWVRYSAVIKPSAGTYIRVAPYLGMNGSVYWREISLVEGNRDAGWSPAPEDTVAQFKVVNNAIASRVSQTDYDSNNQAIQQQFSSFTQTLEGFQAQVADAEGNINRLTETSSSLQSTITNVSNANAASYQGIAVGGNFTGEFLINTNWDGSNNPAEILIDTSRGNKFYHPNGRVFTIKSGQEIATQMENGSPAVNGYIIFYGSDSSRFPIDSTVRSPDFIFGIYKDGQWYYDNNSEYVPFIPNEDDCLVARIGRSSDTVTGIDIFYLLNQSGFGSQISQLADDINLRVQKGDVINQINVSDESILIAGNRVHITGQTTIDNAVIKDAMIQSVSASKLNVNQLSAISANLGNITAGHIKGVTIEGSTISATGGTNTVQLTKYGLELKSSGGNGTYISPGEGIGFGDYFDGSPNSAIYSNPDNTITISAKHLQVISSVGNALQLVGYGGASYIEFYRNVGDSRTGYFGVPSPSNADMGWTNLNGDIDITPVTNVNINGHLTIEKQTFRIITDSSYGYIQTSRSEIRATQYASGTLIPLRASSFPTGSLEEYKQDIQPWEDSVIDIIKNADLYQYRLKSEVEAGIDKIRHGFVIGDGYRTPEMVIDGDGVEQYAMNSLSLKVGQELIARDEVKEQRIQVLEEQSQNIIVKQADHEDRIADLEQELVEAKQRISQLEAA
ncbi:phage minor structural protein [Pullulanibacillus pueri]|uniref:Peptidase S74 domain-containing protein n=1 Tax=Pullulanibacillus pueri TaxID=1437324 RepID=A0A8J3EN64_9BACL|nr:phage tail spike protein [Pullulanibacillus pueri]MBM7681937.1 phage minor structural protein [Pullulanibacillus pueri]GGH83516.1 hypothetical protein GCM10007096_24500 [Pullulanibacillus pueri]